MNTYTYICVINRFTCIHIYACMCSYIYIYMYAYIYIYIYIYMHIYVCIHTYIYTTSQTYLATLKNFYFLSCFIHRFSTFFPPKTGSRLKIVLPSFPASVARVELHLWLFKLWIFIQVHPSPLQRDLSPLIKLTKTSDEGRAVPLCFLYTYGRVY